MNEEKRLRFLKKPQELAKGKGISFEDLLDKAELGEWALKVWEEEGKPKEPEEVIHRPDIVEIIKEIQLLRENLK